MECIQPPMQWVGDETPLAIVSFLLGYLALRFVKVHMPRLMHINQGVPAKMRGQAPLLEDATSMNTDPLGQVNEACDEELLMCAKEIAALRGGASSEELAGIVKALAAGRGLPTVGLNAGA